MIPRSFHALVLDIGQQAVNNTLPGSSADALANPNTGFGGLIAQILNIVLTIGVIAVLFFLIMAGIEWITAGGDSGKIQKAREKITQAIIGLVILISVVAIMAFVQQLMNICILDFGNGCKAPAAATPPVSCRTGVTCVPSPESCNGTVVSSCTGGVCCAPMI